MRLHDSGGAADDDMHPDGPVSLSKAVALLRSGPGSGCGGPARPRGVGPGVIGLFIEMVPVPKRPLIRRELLFRSMWSVRLGKAKLYVWDRLQSS